MLKCNSFLNINLIYLSLGQKVSQTFRFEINVHPCRLALGVD